MANYTAEFNERLSELQSHWRKASSAAKEVGYEKPDDLSWDEAAVDIALKEFTLQGKNSFQLPEGANERVVIEPPAEPAKKISASTPTIKGRYATEYYKTNGIPYCKVCGELFLVDLNGKPTCAESFTSDVCPRLGGNDG